MLPRFLRLFNIYLAMFPFKTLQIHILRLYLANTTPWKIEASPDNVGKSSANGQYPVLRVYQNDIE